MLIVMELPLAYQLIIPEPIREMMELRPGDWVAFEKEDTSGKLTFSKYATQEENNTKYPASGDSSNLALVSDWLAVYDELDVPLTKQIAEYPHFLDGMDENGDEE
jgi:bifunctional DNA-binding transcriptional regulator/antitoxin component of YhaV-PrlF toxin-antitoxin module